MVTNTTAGLFKVQCDSLTTHVGHTTGKGTAETPHVLSNTGVATVMEHTVQLNVNPLSLHQENLHKHKVTLHPNSPIPVSHQSKTIVGKAPNQPSNHKIKSVTDVSHTTKSATPIKLSWIRQFLQGYHNFQYIIDGFTFGFRIGYEGPWTASMCKNLKSCNDYPDAAKAKIQQEVTLGRVRGPFSDCPLPDLKISPIGVVP